MPQDIQHLESLEGRLEVRVLPRTADTVGPQALLAYAPSASPSILRTLQNLGLTVTEELRIPLVLPDGRRKRSSTGSRRRRRPSASPRSLAGEERFVDALRALDEERRDRRRAERPGAARPASAGARSEVLRTLRNHLLQIRTHYNVETVNGVLLPQQRRWPAPSTARSPRASTRTSPATARPAVSRGRTQA